MATDGTNPLVAQRQDTTSTLSGAGVFDDIEQLSEAIDNKSWVSGALAGVALGVDTVAYVSDPLATLMAWGIGWVFDHIQPSRTGCSSSPGTRTSCARTGRRGRTSPRLEGRGGQHRARRSFLLPRRVLHGKHRDRVFRGVGRHDQGIAMTGALSGAVGTAYDVCAVIIQFVHDFVRDAISQVVASILSYAVELVASFGTAFPLVMEQISTKVASLMSGVSKRISALKESLSNLGTKLTNADQLLKSLKEWLHKLTHSDAPKASADAPHAKGQTPDAPNPHTGDPAHNYGTFVDDDGIPHVDPSDPRPYLNPKNRPSFRKGIVDKVRETFTDADGVLHDWRGEPIDWQPGQPRAGIWDMGHKPGHKYSDVWRSYVNGEMTPKEFLDWYNEPQNYRVEFSSRNRAHIDE